MKKTLDLTTGSISRKLILFALPLLFGSLVQQLYNTVDLIFVGNFIGKSASAAIGASSLLITCLVGFFGGMSVGSGVVISQIFGARDYKKLSRAVHNTAALCLAGGLALMVLGYILAPVFLRLINTPEAIRPAAVGYLRIYFLSFFSVVSYNLGSGVIRALGDSRTPLYAQIVVGVLFRVFNREASVIALGHQIIGVTFPFYFIYSILQIVGDSMRGVGKARGPMVIIMTNICVIRTILLFAIVPRWQDIRAVAVAYPITWALTAICMLVYYIHYHKHSQAIR